MERTEGMTPAVHLAMVELLRLGQEAKDELDRQLTAAAERDAQEHRERRLQEWSPIVERVRQAVPVALRGYVGAPEHYVHVYRPFGGGDYQYNPVRIDLPGLAVPVFAWASGAAVRFEAGFPGIDTDDEGEPGERHSVSVHPRFWHKSHQDIAGGPEESADRKFARAVLEAERAAQEITQLQAEAERRNEAEAEQAAADRALADVPTVQAMKSAEGYRKNLEGIADSRDAVAEAVANGFLLLASVIGSQSL